MTRPGTSGAAPGPAGPGDPALAAADQTSGATFPDPVPDPGPDPPEHDADLPEALDPPENTDLPDDMEPPENMDAPEAALDTRDGADAPDTPDAADDGIVTAGDRHPADEHPLASFAADPRMPIWIRRAVLAAPAGGGGGFPPRSRLGPPRDADRDSPRGPGRRGGRRGGLPARLALRPARRGRRRDPGHRPPLADHRGDPGRGPGDVGAAAHPAAAAVCAPVRLPDPERPGHPGHQLHRRSSDRRPGRGVRGGLRALGPPAAAPGHPGRPPLLRPRSG